MTYTREINLKYNQNSFAFRFAALCYAAPEENYLSYTLKGFDKEWYSTTKSSTASYTNLKPGDYTFCVKTANAKGEWSNDIKSIHIHIAPPFWKSPWAYLLYFMLSAAGIGYIFYRFRKQITDKQRRQLEILEAEKEKEIYHAKIDFFTNIAHEIRTPLTLIKGPLENILHKENIDRNTIRENLDVMERNTLRLLDLTNQLLDFRKTETKGLRLNFMDCNISQLIRDTYIRFNPAAQQNGLKFQTDLPEQDFNAPVDKEALTKILSNLFNNAVKYATSSIHVSLIPPCGMKEPGYFSIMVSNDGHPIPHDMQEKIFQPFVQIKQTSGGQRTAGTGIGLPLARSLAELHKGKLYLKDSEEICFCVELPVDQEKAIQLQKDSTISQTGNMQTVIRQHSTNICILVVEDDPEMQNFICAQLETVYCVIRASNGKEALQVLSEKTISLIVSDVMMPEMDGFELCHTLKTDIEHSHIPIILLTAKVTMQSKIEGIELGVDDYIEKPFSTEYLLARIANLLSNQDKLRHAFTSSPFVNAKTIALSKADENFLDKLIEVIQKNISEPDFNVDILAEKMNMSRSSLHRKIKGIAQITPNEFIQLERLKMAAQLIQSGEYRINEVCYIVGFNSSSYFAKCFQKQFGVLPKDFYKNDS
ncbi:response regulator [Phocaeicola dorei]|nr:response regulator [Phocaeicola dorei]